MPTDDRDRQLERALARHLSNSSPDAACPDAEILAAYHERTLSLEEMARWKEHIAGCTRCQEALALVEHTEGVVEEDWVGQVFGQHVPAAGELMGTSRMRNPAAGASKDLLQAALPAREEAPVPLPEKRISRLNWRWVVPVGALAAAVIVWVGVRDIQMANKAATQSVQVAENREAAPVPAAPVPPAAKLGDVLKQQERSVPNPEIAQNRADRTAQGSEAQLVAPPTNQDATGVLQQQQVRPPMQMALPRKVGPNQQAGAFRAEHTAPKEGEAVPAQPASSSAPSSVSVAKNSAPYSAPAPAPPGVAGGAAVSTANQAETKKQKAVPQASAALEVAAPASNASTADRYAGVRDSMDLMRVAAEDRRLIVAPGQKHAWRVGDGGAIERSTDGGKTWKKQNSGVTADLTAGSATSDRVAWIAGKNGTLLLTTDGGKHWKQITTPIDGDLGGVHAVDAAHASIWDLPNRKSFETSDGGETWKPSGNE